MAAARTPKVRTMVMISGGRVLDNGTGAMLGRDVALYFLDGDGNLLRLETTGLNNRRTAFESRLLRTLKRVELTEEGKELRGLA
jgi:hypothetical protein